MGVISDLEKYARVMIGNCSAAKCNEIPSVLTGFDSLLPNLTRELRSKTDAATAQKRVDALKSYTVSMRQHQKDKNFHRLLSDANDLYGKVINLKNEFKL